MVPPPILSDEARITWKNKVEQEIDLESVHPNYVVLLSDEMLAGIVDNFRKQYEHGVEWQNLPVVDKNRLKHFVCQPVNGQFLRSNLRKTVKLWNSVLIC